ncbi:hypothetical protein F5X98DRAFT_62079 [Xylaria grammica]|nr:hypothetical protein F5X98DRAFT_62079 [Xylaria grammica]
MDIYHFLLVLLVLALLSRRLFGYSRSSNNRSTNPSAAENSTKSSTGSSTQAVKLRQVHPPPEENAETDVDIIAIHGLDTNSEETWTWKSKKGGAEVNWLSNDKMLPFRVQSARIFTFDWPSDIFEHSNSTQKTFDEFARVLLGGIATRPQPANYFKHNERPILFIASCLGGIVLMKALVRISLGHESIQKAVGGIVFLATPFSGTSFSDVSKWALPGLKAWACIRDKKVSNLIHITMQSPELIQLRREFIEKLHESKIDHKRLAIFYETHDTSLPRKLIPWLPAFLAHKKPLAGQESATLDIPGLDPQPLARKHVLMNKFHSASDGDYGLVAGSIHNILETIRDGRPLQRLDAYIKGYCYKAENLEIVRISGASLSVESCYVNLVVIDHPAEERQTVQRDALQSSKFSLHNRLNIETPNKGKQVEIWRLFEPRKRNNTEIIPKRILIRGHAGVGKSTLCKKIVYDFKEHNMWCDMFDRVLWVPLRNLKRLGKTNCNLEAMLHEEYFSQASNGKTFACELWKELEAEKYQKSLFILDGLDEVYEGLEKDSHMFKLLETLLNLPTVIVTSRPHVSIADRLDLKFDLELETIGFYPDQVKSYMENVLVIPRGGGPDHQKVGGLQSLLQQHQLLRGLVRIPIQLDALCYIWSDENSTLIGGSVLETMTDIYQAIVGRLWKKDIPRLKKKNGEEIIAQMDLHDASLKTVETYVSDEIYLLERLAFTGMVHDVISFTRSDYTPILDGQSSQILPAKTLPSLSFLRTSNPSSRDPIYHFLHLTFQEYFAARYFVRQWEAEKPLLFGKDESSKEVKSFLAHHKYDTRYDIFWRFVTGLLSLKGDKINGFFQLIGNEPLDILGPVHQRLIMHCLSEVPPGNVAFAAEREKLQCQLGRWLAFNLNFRTGFGSLYALTGGLSLVCEMEFPEAHLRGVLELASVAERLAIVESLVHRPAIPPRVIHLLCSWFNDNISISLKALILTALTLYQGALDNDVLGVIMAGLECEGAVVQREAIKAIKRWPPLRDESLNAVVARAIHGSGHVQLEAISLLGDQPQLDDKVVDALVAKLGDQERLEGEGMRSHYARELKIKIVGTLVRQLQPGKILHPTQTQLKNENYAVRNIAVWSPKHHPGSKYDIISGTITTSLLGEDISIRGVAPIVHVSWPPRNDKILDAIMAYLGDREHWQVSSAIMNAVAVYLKVKLEDVRSPAVGTLEGWFQLSASMLQAMIARTRDKGRGSYFRKAAVETIMNWPQPVDGIQDIITEWLQSENHFIQSQVLNQLSRWPRPSDEIVNLVVARLGRRSEDVRETPVGTLAPWPQFSANIIPAIKALVQDRNKVHYVQIDAFKAIMNWYQHADGIQEIIGECLQNGGYGLQSEVLDKLGRRPRPSDEIVNMVEAELNNNNQFVRARALRALGGWYQLSNTVLEKISLRLNDESDFVQNAAAEAFQNQPQPKDNIIRDIVTRLEAPRQGGSDRIVRVKLCHALRKWPRLDDYVLYAIAKPLAAKTDNSYKSRKAAAQVFRTQPQPNDGIINAIEKHLRRSNGESCIETLEAIGNWPRLDDRVLVTIASHLGSKYWGVGSAAFDALANQSILPFAALKRHMKLIYKFALLRSFSEHVYWLTEDEQTFMVVGTRKVCWKMEKHDTEWLHSQVPVWREKWGLSPQAS